MIKLSTIAKKLRISLTCFFDTAVKSSGINDNEVLVSNTNGITDEVEKAVEKPKSSEYFEN